MFPKSLALESPSPRPINTRSQLDGREYQADSFTVYPAHQCGLQPYTLPLQHGLPSTNTGSQPSGKQASTVIQITKSDKDKQVHPRNRDDGSSDYFLPTLRSPRVQATENPHARTNPSLERKARLENR